MSDTNAFTDYVIPKQGQSYMTTIEEYAFNISSELIERSRIEKCARLIDGCNVITYETILLPYWIRDTSHIYWDFIMPLWHYVV